MFRAAAVSFAACAVVGWGNCSYAQSSQTLFAQISNYQFITARRHNDIQGVESVFDDYRKNWLHRQNSEVLVGNASRDARPDTPICADSDLAGNDPDRMKLCGNGDVARAHTTVLGGRDTYNGAQTREVGNISYVGYERLLSKDFFVGGGLSGAVSRIENNAGSGARVDATEFAGHAIGGYRLNDSNMVAYNLSFMRSVNDTLRPGNITGHYETNSFFATGVWYRNVQLTRSAYVSLGLDYTLQFTRGGQFTETDGTVNSGRWPVQRGWQGDFTSSALFVQPFDRAELFARLGLTVATFNPQQRSVDLPIDIGGSIRLTDKIALTGSIGTTYEFWNYTELRGKMHLTARF